MVKCREIKKKLLARQSVLEEKMKSDMETAKELDSVSDIASGELSAYDNHPADSATQLYEREKDLALNKMERDELRDIKDALKRMKNGTYGIDEKTGEKIPDKRLNALPTARTTAKNAPDSHSHKRRPVEESVIADLDRIYRGDAEDRQFDDRNAFDLVSQVNEQRMIYEDAPYSGFDDDIGYAEDLEGFAATGIDGFRGDDQIQVLRNQYYDRWMDDHGIDEIDPLER